MALASAILPKPFVAACDKFAHTEILRTPAEEAKAAPEPVVELLKLNRYCSTP